MGRASPWSRAAMLAVAGAWAFVAVGCSRAATRQEMEDRYRSELVSQGLDASVAECVVDRFFADLTDAEARSFHEREDLLPEEAARFQELGDECAK